MAVLYARLARVSWVSCRRAVATLGLAGDRLRPLGIETLAVIGTTLDNARLYFRYHPTRLAIAADPALATHRAYGLPTVEATWEVASALRVNPSGELPEALPLWEGTKALGRLDGFKPTDADRDDGKRTWNQSVGEFLIDRDGVVRWLRAEGKSVADAQKEIKLPKYESWSNYGPFLPMNIERYYDFHNRGI